MKSYLRIFFILVSFVFILNVDQAETFEGIDLEIPKNIEQAHKSVWKFEIPDIIDDNGKVVLGGSGTAFFISPNHVVTNFHAIMALAERYKSHSIEDIYLEQGNKRLKLSKVLYASIVDDLVILETKEKVTDYLELSKKKPSGNLFALGYSDGVKQTLIHFEKYGVLDYGYEYNIAINNFNPIGLSGASVLDEKTKKVVGVITSGYSNMVDVVKVSQLEKLRRASIGLDCLKLTLRECIELEIQNLTEKAKEGDRRAKYQVGVMYRDGKGVKEDKKEAFKWMLEAAEQEYVFAQYSVGNMYYNGEGVAQDKEKAFEWYLEAAEQEYVLAQYSVGNMYYNGEGVAQDKEKAFEWYLEVAKKGLVEAQHYLSIMYEKGEGVAQDKEKTFEWELEAANQRFDLAQFQVGFMYYFGEGVKENKEEALKWFLEAAKQDHVVAQYNVAGMYYFGEGVKENKEEALKWYLEAAKQKLVQAQYRVAKMYELGEGVDQDIGEAYEWYSKAAEQGHDEAKEALKRKEFQDYRKKKSMSKPLEILDRLNPSCREIF